MAYDKFLIAPIEVGLEKDLRPWLIPDDAFQELNNAYVFRGRVRKRFGTRQSGTGWTTDATQSLFSRLRISLTATDGAGAANGTVPGVKFKVGQAFSIGTTVYTVAVLGVPGTMLSTDLTTTTMTFNTTTGAYVFAGATPATTVYFYPSEPVMGLEQYYSGSINNQPAYAFDTQFCYAYTGGMWVKMGPTAGSLWHGTDTDFFWACSYDGASVDKTIFYVTNFFVKNYNGVNDATDDPIWYYDGSAWTAWTPVIGPGAEKIQTARIIVPFKDRLVLLNTVERNNAGNLNINYTNRCRYSQNGSPLAANAFLEPNNTGYLGGGWVDAATEEEIISAEFIKDRLIVYFERSTWELAYTGNQILPFVWQKLNSELGSEATFSSVPFDKVVLTLGSTGVHACNGSNVERIDNKIPDEIFKIKNKNEGVMRVAGIRDFFTEMVYWTFPASDAATTATTYPNRVLVYNYKNSSWAYNDDCLTCFGYFEQQLDKTWITTPQQWDDCLFTWNSGVIQAEARQVIAGNHQGFVLIVDPEIAKNEQSMQITNITFTDAFTASLKIYDHTLQTGDFIKIYNTNFLVGAAKVSPVPKITQVTVVDKDTITVTSAPNLIASIFAGVTSSDTYKGGGTVARVSKISIVSKEWNPYVDKGKGVFLGKMVFAVQRTENGEITINYSPSSSGLDMIKEEKASISQLGTNILDTYAYDVIFPLEKEQSRLWHPVYLQADGDSITIRMYLSDTQMLDEDIAESGFQMEGIILFTQATSANLF